LITFASIKQTIHINMTKIFDEKRPLMTQIRELKKGECLVCPMSKLIVLRANLSMYALAYGMKLRGHINREDSCFEVTREA